MDNPLLAFSLIKRLHSDWPNVIYSDEATRNTQGNTQGRVPGLVSPLSPGQEIDGGAGERVEKQENCWRSRIWGPQGKELMRVTAPHNFIYPALPSPLSHPAELHAGLREVEQELPGAEDLEGAARALMRLQDVYGLSVRGLASGVFQRAGQPPLYSPGRRAPLSADDCFHVGKVRESPTAPTNPPQPAGGLLPPGWARGVLHPTWGGVEAQVQMGMEIEVGMEQERKGWDRVGMVWEGRGVEMETGK